MQTHLTRRLGGHAQRWIHACTLLGLLLLLFGCAAGAEPSTKAEALHDRFPAQVSEVLGTGAGFLRADAGFVRARPPQDVPGGFRPAAEALETVLPGKAEAGIVWTGQGGFAPRVREVEATGEGALEGSAVTYARPGGRSYWTALAGGGLEEWLLLEAEQVTSEAPVAVWEVTGAALRQEGAAVAVVDEGGRARLRVTAPRAYAEGGRAVHRAGLVRLWQPVSTGHCVCRARQ